MKKLSRKRKQWLDRHSKLPRPIPGMATRRQVGSARPELSQSTKAMQRAKHRLARDRYEPMDVPQNFSICSNPEETLDFFSHILQSVHDGKPIHLEMRHIQDLSIDAVMYLLAVIKRIKMSPVRWTVRGTVPLHLECNHLLQECGFFNYVHRNRNVTDLSHDSEVVTIVTGNIVDPLVAKRLCAFAIKKLDLHYLKTRKLYDMIIELMSNTKQHAYRKASREPMPDWYVFATLTRDKKAVQFIFLDTGDGIPSTIKRKGWETVRDTFGTVFGSTSHAAYIKSALEGQFRTRTGEPHRGKGLPKLQSFSQEGYIQNLTVVSNHGFVGGNLEKELQTGLTGTLFSWALTRGTQDANN